MYSIYYGVFIILDNYVCKNSTNIKLIKFANQSRLNFTQLALQLNHFMQHVYIFLVINSFKKYMKNRSDNVVRILNIHFKYIGTQNTS